MQRNLSHQASLISGFAAVAGLLLYPAATSLYPLLPPLLGLAYIRWNAAMDRRDYFAAMVWMLYLLVFESVWSLPLYGIWAVMTVCYTIFDPKIRHLIRSEWLINVIGVTLFDLLYLLFLLLYGSLMHVSPIQPDLVLVYYFLADIAGVLLF